MKAIVKLINKEPFLIVENGNDSKAKLCEESLAWIKKYSTLLESKGVVFDVSLTGMGSGYTFYSIYQVMNFYYLKFSKTELFVCNDSESTNGLGVTEKENKATRFTFDVARALREVIQQSTEVVKITY
jgi:hypothetical protein